MKLDMSKRGLGELEKRWKAVEREAGQGERDIKKMQAEVESLRKNTDATGWSVEKERRTRRRCAEQRSMGCVVHRCVFTLSLIRGF